MVGMFYGCSSLKKLNLNNFNTNKVTKISCMFHGCTLLKELNLDNFNTNNVIHMTYMFSGCTNELKSKIKSKYPIFDNNAYMEYNYNN